MIVVVPTWSFVTNVSTVVLVTLQVFNKYLLDEFLSVPSSNNIDLNIGKYWHQAEIYQFTFKKQNDSQALQ